MTSRLLRSQRLGLEGHFEGVLYVFESKAWQQEGYVSFEAYCAELYDDIDVRFPVLERREKVAEMTEKGATTREIGAALGIGAATAMRDQHALVSDETDDDESDAANQLDLVSDETEVEPLLDEPEPQVQDEEAVAPEPANASLLDEFIESGQQVQDAKYAHRFSRALARADDFLGFDAERIATLLDDGDFQSLRQFARAATEYVDAVSSSRKQLRVIGGGK